MTLAMRHLELIIVVKDSVSVTYHPGNSTNPPMSSHWHLMLRPEWPYLEAALT